MAFLPAAADQHASAVAVVTATVHAPVTVRAAHTAGARPTVQAATQRAYSMRMIRGELASDLGRAADLRTIFIDFE